MIKINRKKMIRMILLLGIIFILIYSRMVNLNWGLPYPLHPDERNMANAVLNLNCGLAPIKIKIESLKECFNPHFFAYGQFNLFLAYFIVLFLKFFDGDLNTPISFSEAVISLRLISAVASLLNFWFILKIINLIFSKKNDFINNILASFLIIFSPFFIQFSHFGTTESVLMILYTFILYLVLNFYLSKKEIVKPKKIFVIYLGLMIGLASAVKISSLIFSLPVIFIIFWKNFFFFKKKTWFFKNTFFDLLLLTFSILIFLIVFSPYNLLDFKKFLFSFDYESGVALGKYKVFYTRQFENSIPIIFQLVKIFPYSLGWINYLSWLGFFILSWKKKEINILRLFFLTYFLPTSFLYTKWTRFMAPIMPMLLIFGILTFFKISDFWLNLIKKISARKKFIKQRFFLSAKGIFFIFYILLLIPGIAYLSVYKNLDTRFQASLWIMKNVPQNSLLLSETANVVDIPFVLLKEKLKNLPRYSLISFNFYDLDFNLELKKDLNDYLKSSKYIIIPSRRIFMNYYCPDKNFFGLAYFKNHCQELKKTYPLLNQYYSQLFNGSLGYRKIKEFTSFPKIEIFGKKIIEFNDEKAEETWSVFDHPVIRIYEKI